MTLAKKKNRVKKKEKREVIVTMKVTPFFKDTLVKLASEENRSITAFIYNALDFYIKKNYKTIRKEVLSRHNR